MRRRVMVAVGGLALIALWAVFVLQAGAAQPVITESEAISASLTEAARSGLKGQPYAVAARQMTLAEAAKLDQAEIPPSAAKVGLDPTTPVWLVAMRGEVDMDGKRPGGGQFDNIFIVVNGRTGEPLIVGSRFPGKALPIPVP